MGNKNINIKVFDYIQELDCFKTTKEYDNIAYKLGLNEWNPVVWIGRLFTLDNDYGEHWFDNWDEREELEEKAKGLGYDSEELFIVIPDRYKDGRDGPCHPPELRKKFWTDVLKSLHLSLETLFEEARYNNKDLEKFFDNHRIKNLEERIIEVRESYKIANQKLGS